MYSPEEYDRIVSAELPDKIKSPYLFSLVIKCMLHGPCGSLNLKSPCMRQNHKCKNNYPKDFSEFTKHGKNSYPLYRSRDDGNSVMIRDHKLDNRWVIPYNAYLLAKYDCHINVEICSAIEAVKYIYKYIYKGHDRVIYQLNAEEAEKIVDELKNFQSGRWICAPKAMWRIFAFDLSVINPAVIVLHLHLQDYQSMPFHEDRPLQDIIQDERLQRTMLTEFFVLNRTNKQTQDLNLLYKEFPQYFVWDEDDRIWYPRKRGQVIGRITTAHPIEGERYYLRMLLMHVRRPKSFTDLKTVNGFIACSFKKVTEIRGLFQIDNGAEQCLSEAALYKMPSSLRQLFATILIYSLPSSPKELWDKFYHSLSEDIANQSFLLEEQTRAKVLHLIDEHLQIMGKSIADFGFSQSIPTMPFVAITNKAVKLHE
ncbi:uncharacterized protein LOC113774172 [Coffea eugenioides]|uniref:uncharacterized protein LOC113774172 n=1 Tax=Coffea eugenioides TaxID=49369 RepID=UPI000F61321E|nr:uncharacterized protein LOC113774172 [Coffea eugenioides]